MVPDEGKVGGDRSGLSSRIVYNRGHRSPMDDSTQTLFGGGRQLGPYILESLLGAGGMGEVYRATDTRLERAVAIKILRHGALDSASRERFQREARAASALNHPHICTVYDVGEANGLPYLVMEHLQGQTLRELIRQGPLSLDQVVDLAVQIADALDAAHTHGIVHRDIKPANIFITTRGQAKVMDFGIAKRMRQEDEDTVLTTMLTEPGAAVGTVAYMSPEQARGERLDARTDLFSFGVMLYEMITGALPFRGSTVAVLFAAILTREPEPVRRLRPDAPEGLERIVASALTKDRAARVQAAAELKSMLETLRVPRAEPHTSGRRLNRLLIPLIALLMVAASVFFYGRMSRGYHGPPIQSLAVVPFENRSGGSSEDFVSGLTEALTSGLGRVPSLRVPPVYRGSKKDLPEIAKDLGADAVLRGSVTRDRDSVRVGAELVQASTNRPFWSKTYQRSSGDVFAMQAEILREVAGAIRVPLPEQESKRITDARPVNPEASDLYLRGRYHVFRMGRTDNDMAIQLLEKAAVLDRSFAPIQAELAFAYANKSFLFDPSPEWDDKAIAAIQKAQAMDPDAPEVHYAMAQILWSPSHGFQSRQALEELRKALSVQPGFDQAWHLHAVIGFHVGHLRAGYRDIEKTLSLNPVDDTARYRFGPILSYQTKYQDAIDALNRVPRSASPALWSYQMAWALQSLGRFEEAQHEVDSFLAGKLPDLGGLLHSVRAIIRAKHGDRKGAVADIEEAKRVGSGYGHFHHTEYSIGAVYSVLGDVDEAQSWIEKAAQDGFPNYALFDADPNLERVRAVPRYRDFVAKMRQEWEHIPGETD